MNNNLQIKLGSQFYLMNLIILNNLSWLCHENFSLKLLLGNKYIIY